MMRDCPGGDTLGLMHENKKQQIRKENSGFAVFYFLNII